MKSKSIEPKNCNNCWFSWVISDLEAMGYRCTYYQLSNPKVSGERPPYCKVRKVEVNEEESNF